MLGNIELIFLPLWRFVENIHQSNPPKDSGHPSRWSVAVLLGLVVLLAYLFYAGLLYTLCYFIVTQGLNYAYEDVTGMLMTGSAFAALLVSGFTMDWLVDAMASVLGGNRDIKDSASRVVKAWFGHFPTFMRNMGKGFVIGLIHQGLWSIFLAYWFNVPLIVFMPFWVDTSTFFSSLCIAPIKAYFYEKLLRQGLTRLYEKMWALVASHTDWLDGTSERAQNRLKYAINGILSGLIFALTQLHSYSNMEAYYYWDEYGITILACWFNGFIKQCIYQDELDSSNLKDEKSGIALGLTTGLAAAEDYCMRAAQETYYPYDNYAGTENVALNALRAGLEYASVFMGKKIFQSMTSDDAALAGRSLSRSARGQ